jgi:uncharacterized damage-inducible protein DinB
MADIAERDFTENLFKLLRETFEGPPAEGGNAYLDKGTGLFQTLERVSSEAASTPPFAGGTTIAAHCAHVAYYVRVLHNFMIGEEQTVDWDLSWQVERVDPDEWEALKQDVRRAYDSLRTTLESLNTWGDDEVGDSMAIVVHTAYHLGALRQALRAVEAAG